MQRSMLPITGIQDTHTLIRMAAEQGRTHGIKTQINQNSPILAGGEYKGHRCQTTREFAEYADSGAGR